KERAYPEEGSSLRPIVVRARSRSHLRLLTAAALACVVLGSVSLGLAEPALATATPRQQMFALTNQSRTQHGVQRLKLNSRLSNMATRHSRQMANQGTLFHTANVPRE